LNNPALKEIAEKVDNLTKELANVRKELKILSSISKLDDIVSSVNEIKKFDKKLDSLATSKDSVAANKKMDELATTLKGFEGDIQFLKDAKETEVIIKKIDDILLSLTDTDVIGKKLDDLQGYIAGLSGIEEKVQDLSEQFNQTNEIVGIIVRQLDDLERKYNLSLEKLGETVHRFLKAVQNQPPNQLARRPQKLLKQKKSLRRRNPQIQRQVFRQQLML